MKQTKTGTRTPVHLGPLMGIIVAVNEIAEPLNPPSISDEVRNGGAALEYMKMLNMTAAQRAVVFKKDPKAKALFESRPAAALIINAAKQLQAMDAA